MNKILLVNVVDSYRESQYVVDNLGILSLATILKQNSYNVKIIDFQYEYIFNQYKPKTDFNDEINQITQYILHEEPNIVGFHTLCNNYHIALLVSQLLKKENEGIKILFGGPQATLTANETINKFPWVDVIGIGESETTICPIVDALINKRSLDNISGVVFKKNNKIINNGLPKLINNLDELPFIDYTFFNLENINKVAIDVGRGCPFGCSFCSTKTFWQRKFRLKTAERIILEISYLYNNYNIKNFTLTHDLFTANIKKVMEFCELIISKKLKINWTCSSRVDTLDENVIKLMSSAGCTNIFLGIETGSQRMQKIINKNLKIDSIYKIIKLLKKYNIECTLSFIYGFPRETVEDLKETVELINSLVKQNLVSNNSIQLHELSFFPQTELTNKYYNKLIFTDYINSTMMNKNCLSKEVINDLIKENKFIFPNYFDLKTSLRICYKGLNIFITFIYLRLLNKYKLTFKLLMEYYNNDLLKFFIEYKHKESNLLDNINIYDKNNKKYMYYEPIESIKRFVLNSKFTKYNLELKQVAIFEYDIIMFLHKSNKNKIIKQYPIDVYEAVKCNDITTYISNPIKVKFSRCDRNNINVKKIV